MNTEFEAYAVGLVCASVCTNLSMEEAIKRLNREYPTGISSKWVVSKDAFAGGTPNPHPCERDPKKNHYLFNC